MGCNGDCSCSKGDVTVNSIPDEKSDDDIWENDEVDEVFISHSDVRRSHEKQGYLDGLSHAKENSLQQGFDDLFPEGAKLAISVGKILAKVKSRGSDEMFALACKELKITNILDKKYFDDELQLNGIHIVLHEWETKASLL